MKYPATNRVQYLFSKFEKCKKNKCWNNYYFHKTVCVFISHCIVFYSWKQIGIHYIQKSKYLKIQSLGFKLLSTCSLIFTDVRTFY